MKISTTIKIGASIIGATAVYYIAEPYCGPVAAIIAREAFKQYFLYYHAQIPEYSVLHPSTWGNFNAWTAYNTEQLEWSARGMEHGQVTFTLLSLPVFYFTSSLMQQAGKEIADLLCCGNKEQIEVDTEIEEEVETSETFVKSEEEIEENEKGEEKENNLQVENHTEATVQSQEDLENEEHEMVEDTAENMRSIALREKLAQKLDRLLKPIQPSEKNSDESTSETYMPLKAQSDSKLDRVALQPVLPAKVAARLNPKRTPQRLERVNSRFIN